MPDPDRRDWKTPEFDELGDVDVPNLHDGLLHGFVASSDDTQLTVHFSDAFGQFYEIRLRGVRAWLADRCAHVNYVHSVAFLSGPRASEADILRAIGCPPESSSRPDIHDRQRVADIRNGKAHLFLVRPLAGGTLYAIAQSIEFSTVE